MTGLLGKKIGMGRLYDDKGNIVSVSVMEAGPCLVLGVNQNRVKMGFEDIDEKRLKKPQAGLFKKLNLQTKKYVKEVPTSKPDTEMKVGDVLKVDLFKVGDIVNIIGTSKGKGFQGGVRRWNWKGGPRSHGSTSHRRPGSIGSTTTPGRVIKGHHMPGHMGDIQVTVKNLKVINVDVENNSLTVKGAVPGAKNSLLIITKSKKSK